MELDVLRIAPTSDTPGVLLKPNGFVRIDGRGLFGLNDDTTEKIMSWIREYLLNPAMITVVIISLEYVNSHSAKILISILKEISMVAKQNKQYFVHWCYEEDDDDILERGEYISETLNIPIDFIRTSDIKNCCKSIC